MTTPHLLSKLAARLALEPAHRDLISRFEEHSAIRTIMADAEADTLAARRVLVVSMHAVHPAYEKRIAAATAAAVRAAAAKEATTDADLRAGETLHDARSVASGLVHVRDMEVGALRSEVAEGAQPLVTDALAAVYGLDLNAHIPDLSVGMELVVPGGSSWGNARPQRVEAPGLADWHRAAAVRHDVLTALDAMRYEALSDAEAGEAVTIELRRLNIALAPIKAGTYSVNSDGLIVRDDPVTRLQKVYGAVEADGKGKSK